MIKKILLILAMSIYTVLVIYFPLGGLASVFDLNITCLELLEISIFLTAIVLIIWGFLHYINNIIESDE